MTAPGRHAAVPVLELDDIQGPLLRRRPDDYHGVYLLYEITDPTAARESLRQVLPEITSAASWDIPRAFTLNVAFSYSGLKAIGLPADSLASFPEEFRAGMAARSAVLGDTGPDDPSGWREPLGSSSLHVGVLIITSAQEALAEPVKIASELRGVKIIDQLPVGVPETGREHFGFRDGIGGPYLIGSTDEPLPGHDPIMPGEFILGYEDETGKIPGMPSPDALGRNGTFMAFRQLSCDVASFRRFLKDHASTPAEEELIAAKMVGRWRSGAPLALSPDSDDPELGADPRRNNNFSYYDQDLHGQRVPPGSHIRRINPRDALKDSVVDVKIHRLIRSGAAYGPVLPEGVLEDDGVERGIIFIFMGASLSRQFEFIQQVWINDGGFIGMGTDKDPISGNNDESQSSFTIPAKPVRRRLKGLPAFTRVRGGEYLFLPGLGALRWICSIG
jgi:Dyp-type peroxidase family